MKQIPLRLKPAIFVTLVIMHLGCLSTKAGPHVVRYSFDPQHRLTAACYDQQTALHYQYEASGNRTNQIVVGQPNPKSDYNGDGLYDLWELTYFGHLGVDPAGNPDQDGANNFAENQAWTDPTDPQSYFRLTTATNAPAGFTIRWEVQPNVTYRVWWADEVSDWDFTNSVINSTGVFTEPATSSRRFYSLSVEP